MRKECPKFETCDAPLCPLDPQSLEHGLWYPNEAICVNRKLSSQSWIKAQRKIKKATKDVNRYFTFAMLNQGCVIRSGIVGLDPDSERSKNILEKAWLRRHPKAIISEKQREAGKRLSEYSKKVL